jgi:hypothetical protein
MSWIDDSVSDGKEDRGSVVEGFFKGAGLGFLQAMVTFFLSSLFGSQVLSDGMLFFGLIQLIYVIPIFLYLLKESPDTAYGLAVYAALVALINGACAVI